MTFDPNPEKLFDFSKQQFLNPFTETILKTQAALCPLGVIWGDLYIVASYLGYARVQFGTGSIYSTGIEGSSTWHIQEGTSILLNLLGTLGVSMQIEVSGDRVTVRWVKDEARRKLEYLKEEYLACSASIEKERISVLTSVWAALSREHYHPA